MKNIKQLGIWMDHSTAILMELVHESIIQNTIVSEFTHDDKVEGLKIDEKNMHTKENHLQLSYYKKISDKIKDLNEVLIFGPTDAKNELLNLIKTDHLFTAIKIEIKHADKMTINQMHALVKKYFNNE